MGSTAKCGAGMNVQTRLIALHHLDVPWKPSEVERTLRTIKLFLNKAEFHCFHNYTFYLHENGRSLRQTVKRTPVFVVDNFFRSVDVLQHCAVAGAHSPSGADWPVRCYGAATPHTGHVVICASHLTSPRRPCYIPTPAMWLSIPFLSIYRPIITSGYLHKIIFKFL